MKLGQQETLVVFDCLIADFLLNERSVEVEIWKSACFGWCLHENEEVIAILE